MTSEEREHVARWLNMFPEVQWDRMMDQVDSITAYGWIDRPDGRKDFLVLEFRPRDEWPVPTTSSALLSEEFCRRIYGDDLGGGTHHECERVEHVLGDLVTNKIELAATPTH